MRMARNRDVNPGNHQRAAVVCGRCGRERRGEEEVSRRVCDAPAEAHHGMNAATDLLSTSEQKFIEQALAARELRCDGRHVNECRALKIDLAQPGSVEVAWGRTKVMAVAAAELVEPLPDRPTEGVIAFSVELSSMASLAFEVGRPTEAALALARLLERAVRKCNAIDSESLCVVPRTSVWSVRCDVTVLDCCGNLVDAAVLAALAALKHLRLPAVDVRAGGVVRVAPAEQVGGLRAPHGHPGSPLPPSTRARARAHAHLTRACPHPPRRTRLLWCSTTRRRLRRQPSFRARAPPALGRSPTPQSARSSARRGA